jgi:hypothetical protein
LYRSALFLFLLDLHLGYQFMIWRDEVLRHLMRNRSWIVNASRHCWQ